MALEVILEKIKQDAEIEAKSIIAAAKDEQEKKTSAKEKELEAEYRKNLDKLDIQMKELEKKKMFHVRAEANKQILNARSKMINNAIDKAVNNIIGKDDKTYLEIIGSLLNDCTFTGMVEVLVSPEDSGRITEKFLSDAGNSDRQFVLSDEKHTGRGGIIMRSGKISQNATISMIAELAHEDIVMNLAPLITIGEEKAE